MDKSRLYLKTSKNISAFFRVHLSDKRIPYPLFGCQKAYQIGNSKYEYQQWNIQVLDSPKLLMTRLSIQNVVPAM